VLSFKAVIQGVCSNCLCASFPGPAAAAPLLAPLYTATTSNNTFYLSTDTLGAAHAEASCNMMGGHLASYLSRQEQSEVEQYYIKAGYLFPTFHEFYWFGYQATSRTWPAFKWLDPTVQRKDK
jgi:hypothetical protein